MSASIEKIEVYHESAFVGYRERRWHAHRTRWEKIDSYSGNKDCGRRFDFLWNITFIQREVRLGVNGVSLGYGPLAIDVSLTHIPAAANVTAVPASTGHQARCARFSADLYVEVIESGVYYERFNFRTLPPGTYSPPVPNVFSANGKYYTGEWNIVVKRECCEPKK